MLLQTSAVQVFLAVINLILCTQRMPCENNISTCIGSILAVTILVLEVCATFCAIASSCTQMLRTCKANVLGDVVRRLMTADRYQLGT